MRIKNLGKYVWILNWYPPYLGAGISIAERNKEGTRFLIQLKQNWFNSNLFNTHFGGSLYSMCDPWFVFILVISLGEDFIIWDKSAVIRFKKPGRGCVTALFEISPEKLAEIKSTMKKQEKGTFWLQTEVKNEAGETVAEVEKEIYIRRKISLQK